MQQQKINFNDTTRSMTQHTLLRNVINKKNHPFKHDIIGKSKEQLLNRRSYVLGAISAWKENRYNSTPDRVAYNINYFEIELKIVDKELARFNNTTPK
jgi:hypothetical protein